MPAEDFEDLYDLDDMDDDEVAELIQQELEEYPELDPDLIETEVEDGFVTLTGRVGTEQELQMVEHLISDVLGIANYSNEIVVDELVRAEYSAAADEQVAEDDEVESSLGEEGDQTEPTADHLMGNLEAEMYGTHNLHDAIEDGTSYNPPDRPVQEGTWSEENH